MEETLGKRIMAHRKRLHLTQDQLAEQLGVTAQAVSKWENDQSCPDITMLPRLAALFGTTTDELLGHEKVYETEVVEPDEGEEEEHIHVTWNDGKRGAVLFALFVILVGGLYFAAKFLQWDVGFWSICWPSAALMLGLSVLLRRFRFSGIACTLVGGYFLVENLKIVPLHVRGELIFPTLVLIFGVCLLVDALRKPKKPKFHIEKTTKRPNDKTPRHNYTQDGEHFDVSVGFGQQTQRVCLPRLTSGHASCSFGELTLDLTGCDEICDGCALDISCSFGQISVIVPRQCRVQDESNAAFGALEYRGTPDPDAKTVIHLTGSVSFGEAEVHYV